MVATKTALLLFSNNVKMKKAFKERVLALFQSLAKSLKG